ncbi:uncharacterized protein LOC116162026 [Photinus pyralis]|uniref:uncharacterized protein LOC116162026 n=1 Tax=Photinus pyralis TaxID=7054 RepID=UPI0012670BC0|nr:uncharacterized protein LOC116162026 [Photinus pyralis]
MNKENINQLMVLQIPDDLTLTDVHIPDGSPSPCTSSSTISVANSAEGSASSNFSNISEEFVIVPTENRSISFYGAENIWTQDYEKQFPEFDLKTLLHVVPHGGKILSFYSENKRLTESLRNKLVDLIITHVYSYILKHRLTHAQYNILCSKIIGLFPNESPQTYYYSGKRINNLAVPAKGKLVNKAHNILHQSPDKVYVRKRKIPHNEFEVLKKRTINKEESDAVTWLKHHREPWDEVLQYWKSTFKLRQEADHVKVSDLLVSWPILSDPRGTSLIDSDFSTLYPHIELSILQNWDLFFEKILALRKKEIDETRDPLLQDIIERLKSKETLTADSIVALQIVSLPHIFPPKGRSRSGKEHWKYTTNESVEGIIVHATTPGDIERKVQTQLEKAASRKIHKEVQPYLIVEGPQLSDIRNTYVVIDKIHFHAESTLKGFDILFKSFFALNINYPVQSEHIWYAIQSIFFNIPVPDNKITGNITDLIKIHLND